MLKVNAVIFMMAMSETIAHLVDEMAEFEMDLHNPELDVNPIQYNLSKNEAENALRNMLSHRYKKTQTNNNTTYKVPPVLRKNRKSSPTVAEILAKRIRILCCVMTELHRNKTRYIKQTWGKRCNKLVFMTSAKFKHGNSAWGKTKSAFHFLYDNFRQEADWFLKADNDTYVVVENLRYMLVKYRSEDPVYFGLRMQTASGQYYMHGGAGYLLSYKALTIFATQEKLAPIVCGNSSQEGYADVKMAACLEGLGVNAVDSRDSHQRHRFLPFMPDDDIFMSNAIWFNRKPVYSFGKGFRCCSNNAVSFHRVKVDDMYVLDYLIYHLRPYNKAGKPSHRHKQNNQSSIRTFPNRKSDASFDKPGKNVRILCWVMMHPTNYKNKALHISKTWGKRCNKLIFMSSVFDPSLPSVKKLHIRKKKDTVRYLWQTTAAAFKHVYEKHINNADWFLKADDDTYVIVENLRNLLLNYNPNEPIYLGLRMRSGNNTYMDGGAGYVLSREALQRFGELSTNKCNHKDVAEDIAMGLCLQCLDVKPIDTRDSLHRNRFFSNTPKDHILMRRTDSFWNKSFYSFSGGPECCSDSAVSFHHMTPKAMYTMEYLLYHLWPYGTRSSAHLTPPTDVDSVQKKALSDMAKNTVL